MSEPDPLRTAAPPSPIARFVGGLLMAVGVLIASLGGLCCASYLMSGDTTYAPVVLIFGSVPIGLGLGIVFLGRAIGGFWRAPTQPPP